MDSQLAKLFEQHKELQSQITEKEVDIQQLRNHQEQVRKSINNALEKFGYGMLAIRYFSEWKIRLR